MRIKILITSLKKKLNLLLEATLFFCCVLTCSPALGQYFFMHLVGCAQRLPWKLELSITKETVKNTRRGIEYCFLLIPFSCLIIPDCLLDQLTLGKKNLAHF